MSEQVNVPVTVAGVPAMTNDQPVTYHSMMAKLVAQQQLAFSGLMAQAPKVPEDFVIATESKIGKTLLQQLPLPKIEDVQSEKARLFLIRTVETNNEGMDIFAEEISFDHYAKAFLILNEIKDTADFEQKIGEKRVEFRKRGLDFGSDVQRFEQEAMSAAYSELTDDFKDQVFAELLDDHKQVMDFIDQYCDVKTKNYYANKHFENAKAVYCDLLWKARYAATALGMHFDELDFKVFLKNFSG